MAGEIWIGPEDTYNRVERISEEDFERLIINNESALFGGRIFLPEKVPRRSPLGITVPDGILVSLDEPREWYNVEIEIAGHDVKQHILPQLAKIINIESDADEIRDLAERIQKALSRRTPPTSVDLVDLVQLLSRDPSTILIIDEAGREVRTALSSLTKPIHLLVVTPFKSRTTRYGVLVKGRLPVPGERILLEAPSELGAFGLGFLRILEGRNLLPSTGEIVLKSDSESTTSQIFDDGTVAFLVVNMESLTKLVGRIRRGDRIMLQPLLPFQVYRCTRRERHT